MKTGWQNWDWQTEEKTIPVGEWKKRFKWVEEFHASPDGEKIAAIVNKEEGVFQICENGSVWETEFEKSWDLKYTPDNRCTAIVSLDQEWTLAVDGKIWENRFDYLWNSQFSSEGKTIAAAIQKDMKHSVVVNDSAWDTHYDSMTGLALSENGCMSAVVAQVSPMAEGDIQTFKKGIYTIVVNNTPWNICFFNAWSIVLDEDTDKTAAVVRTSLYDYTIAVNGTIWKQTFPVMWQPQFHENGSIVAPAKTADGWTVLKDGIPFWENFFLQVWDLKINPVSKRIAAIVSPKYGKWTVAENDKLWDIDINDMISDIVFNSAGDSLVAVVKNNAKWTLAVDGKIWNHWFDRVWGPVISDNGNLVVAIAEENGKYALVINDQIQPDKFEILFQPVIHPDGNKILLKGIKDDTYLRKVILI